ncbi:MAG: hypothetical protein JXB15_05680 [Anaerolineales bacterium]|nr:hypothetical protein [Anaerolineales bacterium]
MSGLSLLVYLIVSALVYRLGFPLDDAWIHQTYARNLGQQGEWAFIPGQPSAGSTSPLWSGLLAISHVLHLGPYVWTYLLGWALLFTIGMVGMRASSLSGSPTAKPSLWIGIILVFEWHLVWAAGSGMETLLFSLLILLVLVELVSPNPRWSRLGVFVGLSIWVRPDGLTLVGPVVLMILLNVQGWRKRLRAAGNFTLSAGVLVACYLTFNLVLSASIWPNTFFAKQAEYAAYQQLAYWQRLLDQLQLPLVGVGILLLPAFVLGLYHSARRRAWGWLAGAAWLLGYLGLYAFRLPVTYQHGRYAMPAMIIYFVWSLWRLGDILRTYHPNQWRRVLWRTWNYSLYLVWALFWILGCRSYALDVAFIESEMVDAARWITANTLPGDKVAAHDIGALGYFGERELIDLAGLISPEVIPYLRNEERLAQFLGDRQADYLVTFPGWYPKLVQQADQIFLTQGRFAPMLGAENMAVYRWNGQAGK